MALTQLSTIPDIIAYMQALIREHRPKANVEPGFPIYDMLIEPFADMYYRQRVYLFSIDKLADILGLFDDSGNLLYPEYADLLINKYFIGTEDIQGSVHSIYFYFSSKCDFTVGAGSYITYNTTVFTIDPVTYSKNDSSWEAAEGSTFRIPITIIGQANATYSLPVTSSVTAPWNVDNVIITIDPDGVSFNGARNVSTLISTASPVVNLDLLKNSVSNRSYSNTRSIGYFLKTNTAFDPTNLKQYKILKYRDKYFIDNYVDMVSTQDPGTGVPVELEHTSIKLSGTGKALLDYGNDFYVTEAYLEYVGSNANFPLVEPFTIYGDDLNQIQTLNIIGATEANTEGGTLYYDITLNAGAKTITINFYKSTALVDIVATAEYTELGADDQYYIKGHYLPISEVGGSGITGYIYIQWKEDIKLDASCRIEDLQMAFYRMRIPWTTGVMAPIAMVQNSDPDSALAMANNILANVVTQPFFLNSGFKIMTENTKYKVLNDDNGVFNQFELGGVSLLNSSLYSLLWEIDNHNVLPVPGPGTIRSSVIKIYKSSEKTRENIVAYADLTGYVPGTSLTISEYNASGITGSAILLDTLEDKDPENYIVPKSSIAGFSNDYIYLNIAMNTGAHNVYDGEVVYLVYGGTDQFKLLNAHNGFNDPANMEVGCSVNVSPYRPIIFSIYFNRDYIMPFANTSTMLARYGTLFNELEAYFSNYVGLPSDIDFKTLASTMHIRTGLYVKRLDYSVCSQRGHIVRGTINIEDESTAGIVWADIQNYLAETVDVSHTSNVITEATATNETIYKPILSVIGI